MPEIVIPLTIRDLTPEDLPSCAWSGTATHLASIARALERARLGEVEYLTGLPASWPASGARRDRLRQDPRAGTLWQLAVHKALQSCGIGTILIGAAERLSPRPRAAPGRTGRRGQQPASTRAL